MSALQYKGFELSWLRRGLTNLVGSQHLVRYGTGGRPPKAADHVGGGSQMVIFDLRSWFQSQANPRRIITKGYPSSRNGIHGSQIVTNHITSCDVTSQMVIIIIQMEFNCYFLLTEIPKFTNTGDSDKEELREDNLEKNNTVDSTEKDLEEAVVKIQAVFRGHHTRKSMKGTETTSQQKQTKVESEPTQEQLQEEFRADDVEICIQFFDE
ncbi:Protein of unknown function [Cotesia congregata]|uniref:Uncharacterized protein n=1 Tax=Cotesia congregata TaxID=51543 RepID=A0A8J2HFH3_COTCN|nr:Protein of unknown function [Cotesia congregata]